MTDTNTTSGKISFLIGEIKKYFTLQLQFLKLEGVEKISILISAFVLGTLFLILGATVLFFLSFAIAHLLAPYVGGMWISLLIISAFYLFVLILIYIGRKKLIVNPLVRFLSHVFLDETDQI